MKEDCLFCKIVAGTIPSVKIYEDDEFIVFQDIRQNTKGHSLIVPKEHSPDLLEMNPLLGTKLIEVTQAVGRAMMKGLGADGFNIGVNTKPVAGQVIFHTHVHIIPRYEGDGLKHWKGHEASQEDMVLYAQKIITALDK